MDKQTIGTIHSYQSGETVFGKNGQILGVAVEDSTPIGGGHHRVTLLISGHLGPMEMDRPPYLSSKPKPWYVRLWHRLKSLIS